MYINRSAEEIFRLAVVALSARFLDNLGISVKKIASDAKVSEKQLHFWKSLLAREGPKIFSSLRPGRKKVTASSFSQEKKSCLAYETINHLLVQVSQEGKRQKLSAQLKEKVLAERNRLKQEYGIGGQEYACLLGIDSSTLRRWQRRYQKEGVAGLRERSRCPLRQPKKLPPKIIDKIAGYGRRWQRRHRRIRLTEFASAFRRKYRRLLARYDQTALSDKTIGRYLKEAGLYQEKKERYEGKRGAFHYYFPGAQLLMDTTVVKFLGVKIKTISILDGFSRKIFHQQGTLKETAAKVIRCIQTSLTEAERLGVKVLATLSDHGKPYKASSVRDYLRGAGIYRIFAHPYHPEGKAAIERYFRTLKSALANRWERWLCLLTGIRVQIKRAFALLTLNLILEGFKTRYERRAQPCIDGKSPLQRLEGKVSSEYQRAVADVLAEQERNSQLKKEYVNDICHEFELPQGMKKFLARYPKDALQEAASILRRKSAVEEMTPKHRFYYLAKVLDNQEKKRREAREEQARKVIWSEEQKTKEEQRWQKTEEERRWYDNHPEGALEKAVEWHMVFYDKSFARGLYQGMIKEAVKKTLARYSRLTAGLKVENLCQKVWEKKELKETSLLKDGLSLPEGEKLKAAKEMTTKIIRDTYLQCQKELPVFQGFGQLWRYGTEKR